jgi:hypothetical protein
MITIELSVDRKLLLDILSTGIDESCRDGYWGQIEKYKWYWWYVCDKNGEPDTDKINPELTPETVLCRIRDDEDGCADEEKRPWTDITLSNLEDAFGWTLINYPHTILPFEIDRNKIVTTPHVTECNYDAVTGDIMLQYILFGEVVYG